MKVKNHTLHREGTLITFVDLIHELTGVIYDSNDELTQKEKDIEQDTIIRKIRKFDITTIGDLYLTSGGRIILDKGYGEYFTSGDKKLFTLVDLKSGIDPKIFQKKLKDALGEVKK